MDLHHGKGLQNVLQLKSVIAFSHQLLFSIDSHRPVCKGALLPLLSLTNFLFCEAMAQHAHMQVDTRMLDACPSVATCFPTQISTGTCMQPFSFDSLVSRTIQRCNTKKTAKTPHGPCCCSSTALLIIASTVFFCSPTMLSFSI